MRLGSGLSDKEFLVMAYLGNKDAVALAEAIIEIACVWDDLVDRDAPVSNEQINSMMWKALVSLPTNPFYAQHVATLMPLFQMSIMNWHMANQMEQTPGRSREIAHIARYAAGDVLIYMAAIIGGREHVDDIGPQFKMRLQQNEFAEYDAEMTAKHQKEQTQ